MAMKVVMMAKGIEMARVRVVRRFQRKRSKTRNAIAPPQSAVSRNLLTESPISLEVSQTLRNRISDGRIFFSFSISLMTAVATSTVFAPDSLVTHITTESLMLVFA